MKIQPTLLASASGTAGLSASASASASTAGASSPLGPSEAAKDSSAARPLDASRLAQLNGPGGSTSPARQPAVRTDRMSSISDDAWISDPPALDRGMLDEIKAAVREGRFVIDDRAIARALAEDSLR